MSSGLGMGGRVVGVGAQALLRAVGVAVQVGVLVEAEEGHRAGGGGGVLEALGAVAQAAGVDVPPVGGGEGVFAPEGRAHAAGLVAPGGRVAAVLRRPDGDQVAVGVGGVGEVAGQDVQHRLRAPGGDEVGVNGLVAVVGAVLYSDQHAGVDRVLVKEFVNAVGEVLHHDADRPAQVHGPHLVQVEGDAAGGVLMLLAGHEVVELAVAAQVGADEVGVGRVGVIADVDVEGQVGDLAGVLGAGVAHLVGEPQVGGVGGVHGRGRAPGLFAGEGFAVGDGVFFVLRRHESSCGRGILLALYRNGRPRITPVAPLTF
jgi:hypothetical protein